MGRAVGQGAQRLGRHLARLGVGGPAGHDHHAFAAGVVGQQPRRAVSSAPGGQRRAFGVRPSPRAPAAPSSPVSARAMSGASPGRMRSAAAASGLRAVGLGAISTSSVVAADHGLAQAEEQDRQLLAQVAGQRHEDRGGAGLVDGGPGQPQHQLGREAVAELGVDRVGADDALGQLGPGVGGLVGQAGPADHRHGAGAAGVLGGA